MTFERYISLPFRVGGVLGGILMVPHQYMSDSSPRPQGVVALGVRVSHVPMIMIMMMMMIIAGQTMALDRNYTIQ